MDYAVGKTGRIITARLYEGEDLYEELQKIAIAEDIKSAPNIVHRESEHAHNAGFRGEVQYQV